MWCTEFRQESVYIEVNTKKETAPSQNTLQIENLNTTNLHIEANIKRASKCTSLNVLHLYVNLRIRFKSVFKMLSIPFKPSCNLKPL